MATISQLVKKTIERKKKKSFSRTPILKKKPQTQGIVLKVFTTSPKKPNSALRHVAKIKTNLSCFAIARLPGSGYYCQKFSKVLMEGGRANDLPGVRYSLRRGVYDFAPLVSKKKRRSIYGTSRPENYTNYIRKCFR